VVIFYASFNCLEERRLKLISVLLFCIFLNPEVYSQEYKGSIIRVIDGDTFIFLTSSGSLLVRMLGIDAPERDQPFSRESSEFLSKYLNNQAIINVNGTDTDDRYMGTLFVNGRNINLLSIKSGHSWHYKRYSSDKDYSLAEEYARENKLVIWSLPNPIPPWTWRQRKSHYSQ
jgi:micrococcal nuclease